MAINMLIFRSSAQLMEGSGMKRITRVLEQIHYDEQGHAEVGVPSLVGGVGAVLLGIGAGGGGDWLAIVGGIVLGVGVLGAGFARHRFVDYSIFSRLDKLEK
jgi:hypothetical protein